MLRDVLAGQLIFSSTHDGDESGTDAQGDEETGERTCPDLGAANAGLVVETDCLCTSTQLT
jgi:hypothetical protein